MVAALMILVGVVMAISGVTGRWRPLLHALFPSFVHTNAGQNIGNVASGL